MNILSIPGDCCIRCVDMNGTCVQEMGTAWLGGYSAFILWTPGSLLHRACSVKRIRASRHTVWHSSLGINCDMPTFVWIIICAHVVMPTALTLLMSIPLVSLKRIMFFWITHRHSQSYFFCAMQLILSFECLMFTLTLLLVCCRF